MNFTIAIENKGDKTIELTGLGLRECTPSSISNFGKYSIEYPGGTMNQDGTVTKSVKITGLNNFATTYKKAIDRVCEHQADAIRYAATRFGISPDCKIAFGVQPKKKSWLQKIRDYDDLQSRCNSAEAMRDHYKELLEEVSRALGRQASIITEKSHELKLMSTVADVWQQRLICVQKDMMDATEMIGKRLKFSVGHNHFEIIVGNPVTYAKNCHSGSVDFAVSICSTKDQYNWKIGVISALEKVCHFWDYDKELTKAIFKALAKKYPEIFCDNVVQ